MTDPRHFSSDRKFTRRTALRYGGSATAALAGLTGAGLVKPPPPGPAGC